MAQPSTRRLVTEASLNTSQTLQDTVISDHAARVVDLETLGGLAPGDVSDATIRNIVGNPASTTTAELKGQYVGKGEQLVSVKDYGAKGDGVTSDTAAINAAVAADKTLLYPPGYYPNTTDASFYLYPEMRNYSNGVKLARGLPGSGTTNFRPILQVDKTTNAQRTEGGPSYWDSAIYGHLNMEPTATVFGSAITGRVRTAGVGDGIGVTGSGLALGKKGRAWGMWAYAANQDDGSGERAGQVLGLEVNIGNRLADQPRDGYLPVGEGPYRGVTIVTADSSNRCGIALDIGKQNGSKGWWTGIRLRTDAVEPDGVTPETRSEQIEIRGASTGALAYNGIRFSQGTFSAGLDFVGAGYKDNAAIKLNVSDRIYFGPVESANYLTYNGTTFDLRNMNLSITGKKILGQQRTGWGLVSSFTGTKTRTGYDALTVTTPQLAERLAALIEDLQAHGLIGA